MTLAEINDKFGAARTNKKEFLEKMERIIPWKIRVQASNANNLSVIGIYTA